MGTSEGVRSRQRPDPLKLEGLYAAYAARVHQHCERRVGFDASDLILARTLSVAWWHITTIPDETLPWLLRTAESFVDLSIGTSAPPFAGSATLDALGRITFVEREALLLMAWDGLDLSGAAYVTDCAPRVFRARLGRAKVRFAAELALPGADIDRELCENAPSVIETREHVELIGPRLIELAQADVAVARSRRQRAASTRVAGGRARVPQR